MNWTPAHSHRCELGESPFWHPDEQALYWVDIQARQVLRQVEGQVQVWTLPQEPGCVAPARRGGLVLALRDGIYRAPQWCGPLQRLASFDYDPAKTRFNDGKCDPQGRFWAGTMYEPRDAALGELFCLQARRDGPPEVSRMAGGVTIANGLAWSPDDRRLYWTDTTTATIRVWDWQALHNTLGESRVFASFPPKPPGWQFGMTGYGGRPDGAAVDVQGNYWVAMFEGARVLKLSPQGDVLAEYPVPLQCPTMVCFGGPDSRTLYLTSASYKRSAQELAALPLSGQVLSMPVDVPGMPVNFFDD